MLVFLVLAAQFESFDPPGHDHADRAAGGGRAACSACSWPARPSTLYSQIGLIILIGIAAKNGILIVEFANQLRDEGLRVREAVIEAAASCACARSS